MEHNSQKLINLANKRFGDVLRDGFKLFTQTYKTLILPLALFQVLLIALDILLLTDLRIYVSSLGAEIPDISEDPADLINAFRYPTIENDNSVKIPDPILTSIRPT